MNIRIIIADFMASFKNFIRMYAGHWELRPQLSWLLNKNDEIPLDFIGRFENLDKDFSFVANRIGLKDRILPKLIVGDGEPYTKLKPADYSSPINGRIDNLYRSYYLRRTNIKNALCYACHNK